MRASMVSPVSITSVSGMPLSITINAPTYFLLMLMHAITKGMIVSRSAFFLSPLPERKNIMRRRMPFCVPKS